MTDIDTLTGQSNSRGLSKVVGVVLMVVLVVLLVGTAAVMTTSLFSQTKASAAYHGISEFDYRFTESNDDLMRLRPEALSSTEQTKYQLEINGYSVYEWDGSSTLEMTCLYPGDRLTLRSQKGDTTYRLKSHTMKRSTRCERISAIDKKYQYAFINGEKRQILPKWNFKMEINPDGPGGDSGGRPMFKQKIGTIPTTNEWHYMRRYTKPIEGFEPPVWVIVMTDNVHWQSGTNYNGLNWTDEPPGEPGKNSYYVNGNDVVMTPGGSEPTNDIYIVFKPGCSKSKLKIIGVSAGYTNRIYVNDKVAVPNTKPYNDASKTPKTLDAPAVECG